MALPVNRSNAEVLVHARMADLSTASSAYAAAPCSGHITRVYSVISNAITSADSAWTVEINGTAITGVSVTVANSNSAAGDVDSYEIAGVVNDETNWVNEGDCIEFITNGNSSTTCVTSFYAVIGR